MIRFVNANGGKFGNDRGMKEGKKGMTKERLQIYIDPEHRDALEELKELLAVDDLATDSALIRYIILELYRLKTKENIQMRALLNRLDELLIYSNSFAETMDVDIFDLESSEKYKEVKTQQRGKWANSRRKKVKNRPVKRPLNVKKEKPKEEKKNQKSLLIMKLLRSICNNLSFKKDDRWWYLETTFRKNDYLSSL